MIRPSFDLEEWIFQLISFRKQGRPRAILQVADAKAAGAVTINYGLFINSIISFLIVAFAVFMVVRAINRMHRGEDAPPATKLCPECASVIPIKARRCPHCTSQIDGK